MKIKDSKDILLLVLGSALLFLPFLGNVHLFDWDELNFAECAREMIITGDYFRARINYLPFWEKPPLFFWLQALSMKTFGINEFAARFPNALCGMLTSLFLCRAGTTLHNRNFGMLWAIAYLGSILPAAYFRSGIIDPWFNLFIFTSFFLLFKSTFKGSKKNLLLTFFAGFLLGLAVLTKGPAAFLIIGLTFVTRWVLAKFKAFISLRTLILFGLGSILPTLLWFGVETMLHGPWFLTEFIEYQYRLFSTPDAGHAGFPGFHLVVLLVGVFPSSIFALPLLIKRPDSTPIQQEWRIWVILLLVIVVVLFTIVQSKIIHYSSLSYFPITYLAALYVFDQSQKSKAFHKGLKIGIICIGGLYILSVWTLVYAGHNQEMIAAFLKEGSFERAVLSHEADWKYRHIFPSFFLLLGLISFHLFQRKQQISQSAVALWISTALFLVSALILYLPKIEGYTQGATIAFFKSKAEEDCYFMPFYKTYAHYFYGQQKHHENENFRDGDWLLVGPIDKDAYFARRIDKAKWLNAEGRIKELYRKNGFIFFKRSHIYNEE